MAYPWKAHISQMLIVIKFLVSVIRVGVRGGKRFDEWKLLIGVGHECDSGDRGSRVSWFSFV